MATLMLDLKDPEIGGLLALCRADKRSSLLAMCGSQEEATALNTALDEITWQLASSGHEEAIETLSNLAASWLSATHRRSQGG